MTTAHRADKGNTMATKKTKATHTPAPWRIVSMPGYSKHGWVQIFGPNNEPIVTAAAFERHFEGEAETHFGVSVSRDDIALLLAAPDLLAALRSSRARIADSGHEESCSLGLADAENDRECDCELGALLERVDAAIAKATGGES